MLTREKNMIPHIHMSHDIYFSASYLLSNVKMMTEIQGRKKGWPEPQGGQVSLRTGRLIVIRDWVASYQLCPDI